jgi:AcrR family transcriptional regulator
MDIMNKTTSAAASLIEVNGRRPIARQSPQLRKQPKQTRSRMLVDSLKQACRMILEKDGAAALSATHLSKVSGVAVGSIYQYFPNLQAIVAEVMFDEACNEVLRQVARAEQLQGCTFEQVIRRMIRTTLSFYRRALKMDEAFCKAFCEEFDLDGIFNLLQRNPQGTAHNISRIVQITNPELSAEDVAMRAFLMTRTLRSIVLETIRFNPAYLDAPTYEDSLVDTALVVLGLMQPQRSSVC